MNEGPKTVHSPPLKEVFALRDPMPWANRWGERVNLCAPVFIWVPNWRRGDPHVDDFDQVPDGMVELLDINLEREIGPIPVADLGMAPDDCCWDIPSAALAELRKEPGKRRPAAERLTRLAAELASRDPGGPWERFDHALNKSRYEASAWFERDRKSLILTDLLDGREVFALWDEDVDFALDSGYLTSPRRPRPSDADWLSHLIDYAQATGCFAVTQREPEPGRRRTREVAGVAS